MLKSYLTFPTRENIARRFRVYLMEVMLQAFNVILAVTTQFSRKSTHAQGSFEVEIMAVVTGIMDISSRMMQLKLAKSEELITL